MNDQKLKSLNNYSVEELLELNRKVKSDGTVSETTSSDIDRFISIYDLKEGQFKVTVKSLYKLYNAWSSNPVSPGQFILRFSFFYKTTKGYVKINRKVADIIFIYEKLVGPKRRPLKNKSYKKHIEDFIEKYSIFPGTYYISGYLLHGLYIHWNESTKRITKIRQIDFIKFMKLYFEFKKSHIGNRIWFAVDDKIMDNFTPELLKDIENGFKYGHQKKSKNSKTKD